MMRASRSSLAFSKSLSAAFLSAAVNLPSALRTSRYADISLATTVRPPAEAPCLATLATSAAMSRYCWEMTGFMAMTPEPVQELEGVIGDRVGELRTCLANPRSAVDNHANPAL